MGSIIPLDSTRGRVPWNIAWKFWRVQHKRPETRTIDADNPPSAAATARRAPALRVDRGPAGGNSRARRARADPP